MRRRRKKKSEQKNVMCMNDSDEYRNNEND